MTTTDRIRQQAVIVVDSDIPAGLTLREHSIRVARQQEARQVRRRRLWTVRRRAA